MNTLVQFAVYGCPQPQGSTRAFIPKGWTRPVITTDNATLKPWRQQLSQTAFAAMNESGALRIARGAAVSVRVAFYFERPKSAKKSARWKITKPDLDKLLRAVLDGLTGIAYEDDAQVCECAVAKLLGSPARVEIQKRFPQVFQKPHFWKACKRLILRGRRWQFEMYGKHMILER